MNNKYIIDFTKSAKLDLLEIVNFYNSVDRMHYAKKIYFSIKKKIQTLAELPAQGRIISELHNFNALDFRELIEEHWRIIYKIHKNKVTILAILDSRRDLKDLLIQKLKMSM